MTPKFITNSISTRTNVPSLSDIVKAAQTKAAMEKSASSQQVTKTASAAAPAVKAAGEKGKSNPKNLTAPRFGKGGKPEAAKQEAPKATASAKKVAEHEKTQDEAESSGQLDVEPLHQKGESTQEKPGDLETMKTEKKASEGGDKDEAESSGQLDVEPLHQKGESTQEKPGDLETMKSEKKESNAKKQVKTAKFLRVAELTPKQKDFLRGVWSLYWPKKFIDALLAD